MNVWRLMTHHENPESALAWSILNNRIAIGWGNLGDLSLQQLQSPAEISGLIRYYYPGLRNSGTGGKSLWNFYSVMQKGDLVILSVGRRALAVEVVGDYEFSDAPVLNGVELSGDYCHQRQVKPSGWDVEKLWHIAGAKITEGQSRYQALVRCEKSLL